LATYVGEAEAGDGMEAILVSEEGFEGKPVEVPGYTLHDHPGWRRAAGSRFWLRNQESSNLELGPSGWGGRLSEG
jgi:hypothetical protein